jgi:hypothetical protein
METLPAATTLRLAHQLPALSPVMTQLRGEIADELARRGAPADVVRAIRESGPQADRRAETA